jgi:hypothetical protein
MPAVERPLTLTWRRGPNMRIPLALAATIALACSILPGPSAALGRCLLGCAAGRAAEPAAPDPDLLTAAELAGAPEASVYEAVLGRRSRT